MRYRLAISILLAALTVCTNGAFGGERSRDEHMVVGRTWQWVSSVTPTARIKVEDPRSYTMTLRPDGKALMRIDCSNGGGSYTISQGTLAFGPLKSTRKACPPGTLDAAFIRDLQRVDSFYLEDGKLFLGLPMDSGTMQFRATDQ